MRASSGAVKERSVNGASVSVAFGLANLCRTHNIVCGDAAGGTV
jgi:hypothetical protein